MNERNCHVTLPIISSAHCTMPLQSLSKILRIHHLDDLIVDFGVSPPCRYINDYPTGRILRDAKLYEIGAGTSEIRRLIIGRALNAKYK